MGKDVDKRIGFYIDILQGLDKWIKLVRELPWTIKNKDDSAVVGLIYKLDKIDKNRGEYWLAY